ncbi:MULTISPECIES: roadblock/LC7 domain-containing protein [unclassified Streptomyces]|uniref:roadblock/LC7 domain-containing protein n=1 Tax=unclassified Streptomyces TaxID=2593676 RepID=UPI0029A84B70|nr:roadblock/LC7 domain-containing protein [Streptomyces sp. MI02-7b]MDX3071601.1 roadblock/LC7 domain-containing protein [Streptomyces sp. MI02-7b]
MALEADVLAELRSLRTRVPHLTGGLVASADGLVVAHDLSGPEPEGVAALTAAALGVAARITEATERGAFRELIVRGDSGYVAAYAAGSAMALALVAGPGSNVGRLHLEARRSSRRIEDLVDLALQRQERK